MSTENTDDIQRGQRLKLIRKDARHSTEEYAKGLGIDVETLSLMEDGKVTITADVYYQLALKYDVDFYNMYNRSNSPFDIERPGLPDSVRNKAIVDLLTSGIKIQGDKHVRTFSLVLEEVVNKCYPEPEKTRFDFSEYSKLRMSDYINAAKDQSADD